jgi:hypothetical protein
MAIKLNELESNQQQLVDVASAELHQVNGGALAKAAARLVTKNPAIIAAAEAAGLAIGGPIGASLSGD